MKRLLLALLLLPSLASAQDALRIDPMTLVALREARSIAATLDLFPRWDFSTAPVLLYRPGVQDVVLNLPDPPEGFVRYTGPSPLGDEPIWVRNDSTLFSLDAQNTAAELDGHRVLVVADPMSQMRNQLRSLVGMDPEQQTEWLEDWSFLGSPYALVSMMLHEGFHVHQYAQGDKFPEESLIAQYPLYDASNSALQALEGLILLASVRGELAPSDALRQFAAVRSRRHAGLGADLAAYEMATEYVEGLAQYVEYRFYQTGASLQPHPEMFLADGFDGYARLGERFDRQLGFAEGLIRGTIKVNGDAFGTGNLKLRLYPMGAMEALLLDEVAPGWTERIFDPGVFPSTLLVEAAGLSDAEAASALAEAKAQHGYDALLAEKQIYERDGRAAAQAKAERIEQTDRTLVRIAYGGLTSDAPRLGYTPFGVTPLGNGRAIYDVVPISAEFSEDSILSMETVTPVLVDRGRQELLFAVNAAPEAIEAVDGAIQAEAFVLDGRVAATTRAGNEVRIDLQ